MSETTEGPVLFLCPHNAAKSVMAVAYFERYAAQAGLDVAVDSAGTEPDTAVWPAVVEALGDDGVHARVRPPRHVTAEDLEQARMVISMGCDLADLPAPTTRPVQQWDDLPLASKELVASRDAIRTRVQQLVSELSEAGRGTPRA
jgi:protein-tyrosine-phosphatase